MSPIGYTLLNLCDNNLTIDRSEIEKLYAGDSLVRARRVARLIGITIKG